MSEDHLERDKTLATKDFKTYIGKYQIKGRDLNYRLRFYINDWLAQPSRIKQFSLDSRPFYEIASIADAIEYNIRAGWAKKAKENKPKKPDPSPRKDPRNFRLI